MMKFFDSLGLLQNDLLSSIPTLVFDFLSSLGSSVVARFITVLQDTVFQNYIVRYEFYQ